MKFHILALAAVLLCPLPADAQTVQTVGNPPAPQNSDLAIQADVHIDSLRFDVVPNSAALHVGGINEIGGYKIARYNLPKNPRAGVTYRNVRIVFNLDLRFTDPKSQSLYNNLRAADLVQKP